MNVLEAININKKYGKSKIALENASIELKQGEILGLLGPNGAGKTTLVKILATLLSKDSGIVNIMGYNLDRDVNNIRYLIGYTGQDTERSAYARLTSRENLRFFGALRGLSKDEVDDKIDKYAESFNFTEILDKQFMHLSGGQKQTVIIFRSLLHDPPIIFLDEPTKGLDPFVAHKIRDFLKSIVENEKKSIILTSHILHEVDYLSHRCSLIDKGRIHITDTPDNLKHSIGVSDFIELYKSDIPDKIIQQFRNLDEVISIMEKEKKDGVWYSIGVTDLFDGTEAILRIMKKENVKAKFKQHTISLEDAFIHYIGQFRDEYNNGVKK